MNSVLPYNLDISTLSVEQITFLQKEIEKHKVLARQREIATIKDAIAKALEDGGLSVSDLPALFPSLARSGSKARVAYRHPEKPRLTWTGKGRRPAWVVKYLAGDASRLQDLVV